MLTVKPSLVNYLSFVKCKRVLYSPNFASIIKIHFFSFHFFYVTTTIIIITLKLFTSVKKPPLCVTRFFWCTTHCV